MRTADRLNGIGEYWFSKKLEEVRQLKSKGRDIINLGIGSPDLAPSTETLDAAAAALKNPANHGYAPYRSTPELRKAMADWYMKIYSVRVNPDTEILPLLGSKEGILYTNLAFVNPGDSILIPDPGYPAYTSVAKLIGARVEYYSLKDSNDWLPDFEELGKRDLKNCRLMWVNYPHMPTGRRGEKKLFQDLITFAREKKIFIAHDNPYGLVLNEEPPLSILNFNPEKDCCLEFNSFSKAFNMAGWRVGMLSGSKQAVDAVLQVKSNVDSGMFMPVQAGAIAALRNSDDWHRERNDVYRERRGHVRGIFDALKFKYDERQVGLFVWAKAPEDIGDIAAFLDKILYEADVFLTPGFIFGENGKRYARSSLCASAKLLAEAEKRVRRWVEK